MKKNLKRIGIIGVLWMLMGSGPVCAQSHTVSMEQKVYELSVIWKEMSFNFDNMNNCPGLDMDSLYRAYLPLVMNTRNDYEYALLLQRYLSCFNNGHTTLWSIPRSYMPDSISRLCIITEYRGGKLYLSNFARKYADKMKVGDELISINGMDAVTFLKENYVPYISGSRMENRIAEAASFSCRNALYPPKTRFDCEFKGTKKYKMTLYTGLHTWDSTWNWVSNDYWLPYYNVCLIDTIRGIGYLHLINASEETEQFFEQYAQQLETCRQVVLDLTHDIGGNAAKNAKICSFFSLKDSLDDLVYDYKVNKSWYRSYGIFCCNDTLKGDADNDIFCNMKNGTYFEMKERKRHANNAYPTHYKGNVYVLMGRQSASATEGMIETLRQNSRASIYGKMSAGATGNPLFITLPYSSLTVLINTLRSFDSKGIETSQGLVPDIEMDFTDCYKSSDANVVFENIRQKLGIN